MRLVHFYEYERHLLWGANKIIESNGISGMLLYLQSRSTYWNVSMKCRNFLLFLITRYRNKLIFINIFWHFQWLFFLSYKTDKGNHFTWKKIVFTSDFCLNIAWNSLEKTSNMNIKMGWSKRNYLLEWKVSFTSFYIKYACFKLVAWLQEWIILFCGQQSQLFWSRINSCRDKVLHIL